MQVQGVLFCPISRKSDQHLFSPNIITSSRENVMRINKIITSGKIHLLSNSLNEFWKEVYGDQSGEFVFGYWRVKS